MLTTVKRVPLAKKTLLPFDLREAVVPRGFVTRHVFSAVSPDPAVEANVDGVPVAVGIEVIPKAATINVTTISHG